MQIQQTICIVVAAALLWLLPGSGAASEPLRFFVFGDSQSVDYAVFGDIVKAAVKRQPDVKLVVHVGDMVDNGQDEAQWRDWFAALGELNKAALIPAVGNHETYTLTGEPFAMPEEFKRRFKVPLNGPAELLGQVYSVDYGAVHFAVLDTQFGEERAFIPDSRELQLQWLAADLAATDKRWKVVVMHRPPYHNRPEDSLDATAAFVPLFEKYGVDVVFTGHDHVNAGTLPLRQGQPSPDGVVYIAAGRTGSKVYQNRYKKDWNSFFYNPLAMPTYCAVTVTDSQFSVDMLWLDGKLLKRVTVTKSS